jgi:two-component system, NarL family, sensor histidine kinase UhpB
LRWIAKQHEERTGIATEVMGELNDVPSDLAIVCFRAVQEALTNVMRHAQARHVRIELSQTDIEVDSEPGRGTCIRISFPVTASLRAPPRKTRV